jgi:hypothetical protein
VLNTASVRGANVRAVVNVVDLSCDPLVSVCGTRTTVVNLGQSAGRFGNKRNRWIGDSTVWIRVQLTSNRRVVTIRISRHRNKTLFVTIPTEPINWTECSVDRIVSSRAGIFMAHVLHHNVAIQLVRITVLVPTAPVLVGPFNRHDRLPSAVSHLRLVVGHIILLSGVISSCAAKYITLIISSSIVVLTIEHSVAIVPVGRPFV